MKLGDEYVSDVASVTKLHFKIIEVNNVTDHSKKKPTKEVHLKIENINVKEKDFCKTTFEKLKHFTIAQEAFEELIERKIIKKL
jgi:hypothetical protein